MRKTTVYLSDEEVDALRRVAAETGRSQADLIREGVRQVTAHTPRRKFRSLGKGKGPGGTTPRWNPAALYEEVFSGSDSVTTNDS
jgi:hypothetical protein